MKLILTLVLTALLSIGAFAQEDSLQVKQNIEFLETKIENLQNKIQTLETNSSLLNKENESLKKDLKAIRLNFFGIRKELGDFIKDYQSANDSLNNRLSVNERELKTSTEQLNVELKKNYNSANKGIENLNESLSKNMLYWIIATLAVTIVILIVFLFLRKQIFKQKSDFGIDLEKTKSSIEQESIKLDGKLVEILETQLKILNNSQPTGNKNDHALALKVADEIIRIQKNIVRMDSKTKGLKQLTASVKRIQDNFASNGYEIIEMLGKKYSEGMKASVTYNPDSDQESGIITRVIKPQVNYNNQMIQAAQIEVSE